eukprot:m.73690 g.73690  ORF g.73690 m.73690 type:complete len:154 (-) comp14340_c0_seq4:946-1407(-)
MDGCLTAGLSGMRLHELPPQPGGTCATSDVTCAPGSYNVHGFNLIFMMGELLLNNMPIIWSHSLFVMIWLFAYGVYSWLVYDYGNTWVYFFLDTTKQSAPAWYSGLFFLHLCFYYLVYGINRLKQRCFGASQSQEEQDEAESSYLLSTNSSMA